MSVGNVLGFPLGECVAKFDNTAVSKAFSNQFLYIHQGQSSALYRVTWYVCLTKAASISSWIGGCKWISNHLQPIRARSACHLTSQPNIYRAV